MFWPARPDAVTSPLLVALAVPHGVLHLLQRSLQRLHASAVRAGASPAWAAHSAGLHCLGPAAGKGAGELAEGEAGAADRAGGLRRPQRSS